MKDKSEFNLLRRAIHFLFWADISRIAIALCSFVNLALDTIFFGLWHERARVLFLYGYTNRDVADDGHTPTV